MIKNEKKAMFKRVNVLAAVMSVLLGVLMLMGVSGCKKDTPKVTPSNTPPATVGTAEQEMCPIMDAPINKELYTEYKGKKVYFCCPGCEEEFTKDPEKYIAKLPQFK